MRGLKRVARRFEDGLSGLDWRAFERLLAGYYRERGYRVEHCGTGGGARRFDGGVDLRLDGHGETVLVQCKHWNALKVPHNAAHELLGIVVARQATRGILVNTGEFTEAAKRAAVGSGGRLELIDGAALRAMLGDRAMASGQDLANVLRDGFAGYRTARRAHWSARVTGTLFGLGMLALGVAVAMSILGQGFGSRTQRAERASAATPQPRAVSIASSPPAVARPAHSRAATGKRVATPRLTTTELQLRRELVRNAARELNGVTSAAWLPNDALFLGMSIADDQTRAEAALDACVLLARYPELPQAVEVQQTGAAGDGSAIRVGCNGQPAVAPPTVARRSTPSAAKPSAPQPEIVMYGSPNCGYCRQAEACFARRCLAFRNLDITGSTAAHSERKRLGGRGTSLS